MIEALRSYQPRTEDEAVDLKRVRELDGDPWSRANPLHVTGSALIVHPPSRRLLLRWHVRQQAWLQVGGHGDPGEYEPLGVALREAEEETGLHDLAPWPDDSIVHVVIVSVPAASHEPAHEHADIRFVLATATPDDTTPESPRSPLRWLTLDEAYSQISEPNLVETVRRAAQRFGD